MTFMPSVAYVQQAVVANKKKFLNVFMGFVSLLVLYIKVHNLFAGFLCVFWYWELLG